MQRQVYPEMYLEIKSEQKVLETPTVSGSSDPAICRRIEHWTRQSYTREKEREREREREREKERERERKKERERAPIALCADAPRHEYE